MPAMPSLKANGRALLDAVKQLPAEEFDAFIERALSLRARPRSPTLSAEETRLIKQINRGLSAEWERRYARLEDRRKKGKLTASEVQELLALTHEAESRDAERAAALVELARLRGVPVRTLMKQMGLETPPIHG